MTRFTNDMLKILRFDLRGKYRRALVYFSNKSIFINRSSIRKYQHSTAREGEVSIACGFSECLRNLID